MTNNTVMKFLKTNKISGPMVARATQLDRNTIYSYLRGNSVSLTTEKLIKQFVVDARAKAKAKKWAR